MKQYTPTEEETIEAFSRELGIILRKISGEEIKPNDALQERDLPKLVQPSPAKEA